MGVHEHLHEDGNVLDLASETSRKGVGDTTPSLGGGSAVPTFPGETSVVQPPTPGAVTPTDGQLSVAYVEAAGGASVEAVCVVTATGAFVAKKDDAATPVAFTGLTNGTGYTVYLRTVQADGRVSPFASSVAGTPAP